MLFLWCQCQAHGYHQCCQWFKGLALSETVTRASGRKEGQIKDASEQAFPNVDVPCHVLQMRTSLFMSEAVPASCSIWSNALDGSPEIHRHTHPQANFCTLGISPELRMPFPLSFDSQKNFSTEHVWSWRNLRDPAQRCPPLSSTSHIPHCPPDPHKSLDASMSYIKYFFIFINKNPATAHQSFQL